jgi:hypothetical protein
MAPVEPSDLLALLDLRTLPGQPLVALALLVIAALIIKGARQRQ